MIDYKNIKTDKDDFDLLAAFLDVFALLTFMAFICFAPVLFALAKEVLK